MYLLELKDEKNIKAPGRAPGPRFTPGSLSAPGCAGSVSLCPDTQRGCQLTIPSASLVFPMDLHRIGKLGDPEVAILSSDSLVCLILASGRGVGLCEIRGEV